MSSEQLKEIKGGRWAARLWIEMAYAPILYVNFSISNASLFEHDQFPSSLLSLPDSPDEGGCDWRLEHPVAAYVAASRGTYEMRILEGGRERILTTGEGRGEDHPDTMYRLSEEWASKLGLVSAWSRLTSSGVSSETAFGRRAIKRTGNGAVPWYREVGGKKLDWERLS
ncbi:hypothetical protein BDY24DRAFT_412808 [Mrakia frigida]|uniref:uncharacterized protein n=1 Tax=Mrakia frigida TaxID=29902 RepID=UPI003FCC2439